MRMGARIGAIAGGLVVAASISAPARAQTPRTEVTEGDRAAPRWEIGGYGGLATGRTPSRGSPTLPVPGPPILTSSPAFPSRQVPSWFFGDGSKLLNSSATQFGLPSRITALDSVFGSLPSGVGGSAGARVTRRVTRRLSIEGAVDILIGAGASADALRKAGETARDSFKAVFTDLFATGPLTNVSVSATSTVSNGLARQIVASGVLTLDLDEGGAFIPYVTFGGGLTSGAGGLPSVTLSGHYAFKVLGDVPIDETDRVTLRYGRALAPVGIFGGGLRQPLGSSWSMRIDARVIVGINNTRLFIDADPSSVRGTPAGFIEVFTSPSIQFSNDPATGRKSTLSLPLKGVTVFTGAGLETRLLITVGLARRF